MGTVRLHCALRCVVGLAVASFPAFAYTVMAGAQAAELATAERVVDVHIDSVLSENDPQTDLRFRAHATVEDSGEALTIVGAGGEKDGFGVSWSANPIPYAGRHYRAHLRTSPQDPSSYNIVGFDSGLVDLDAPPPGSAQRTASRNRVDGSNGNGDGPYLFWPDVAFPVPFVIGIRTLPNDVRWVDAVVQSFHTWRGVAGTRFELFPAGCSEQVRGSNDGTNLIYVTRKDWPFSPTIIAVTRTYFITGVGPDLGRIVDADIVLNGVHHEFSVDNVPNTFDVQSIITHEAGHFLGLGHEVSPVNSLATMYESANVNEFNKRVLSDSDIAGIRSAYPGPGVKLDDSVWAARPCTGGPTGGCAAGVLPMHGPERWGGLGSWLLVIATLVGFETVAKRRRGTI